MGKIKPKNYLTLLSLSVLVISHTEEFGMGLELLPEPRRPLGCPGWRSPGCWRPQSSGQLSRPTTPPAQQQQHVVHLVNVRDVQRLPTALFPLVLRKEYFDCPERDSYDVHYFIRGEREESVHCTVLCYSLGCSKVAKLLLYVQPHLVTFLVFLHRFYRGLKLSLWF